MSDKVIQFGVLEGILCKVSLNTLREHASTELEEGLIEPGSALSVRDTIENILSHFSVHHIHANWMSSLFLVLLYSIETLVKEDGPGIFVFLKTWGFVKANVANVVGKAFIEPQVIPPLHGHEVAEPHVRDLVQKDIENGLLSSI